EEYHQEQGKRTAFEEGIEEGVKKGEQRKSESIARKMLSLGMDVDQIVTVTGPPLDEIQALA
ncbi:MAG: Rpn family recombination-promoting nuclease/putative transposase, partial [Ardenticatenaceae bacterium]